MATFILRQSIEGDVLVTVEQVDGLGPCWTDGLGNYIPGSLSLVINGAPYPVTIPEFFGLGFMGINMPQGVVLKAGDTLKVVSNCSPDDSLETTALSINLLLTTSDASTCLNTAHINATYQDRIRLFFAAYNNASPVFNLSVNSVPIESAAFFSQLGYQGNITSVGGDYFTDPAFNSVLFSNNLFAPITELHVLVLDAMAYFTVRLGYIEIVFSGGQLNLIDYITGLVADNIGGGYQALDTVTIRSDLSSYLVAKQQIPFYSIQKSVEYIVPPGGGSINPNPSVIGIDATWTLPTVPADYPIQVKLGDKVTAQAIATVMGCPLVAFNSSANLSKGTTQNALPGLTGTAPNNCVVTGYKILTLPACGTLFYNGNPASIGQEIGGNPGILTMDVPANCPQASLEFEYAAISTTAGCQQSSPAKMTVALKEIQANAVDDSFTGIAGVVISHNVATNDQACSTGSTFYQLVPASAQHGTVDVFNPNTGYAEFTPETAAYTGQASYQYNLLCGISMADAVVISTAMVSLYFFGGTFINDSNTTYVNTAIDGNVATNDMVNCQSQVSYALLAGSQKNGLVTFLDAATGDYTFSPAAGYVGPDAGFGYQAFCNGLLIGSAEVSIKVFGADLNPDINQTLADVPVKGQVKPNDSFYCEGVLTLAVKPGSELNGIVNAFDASTGEYTFTPALKFTGTGQFSYQSFCNGVTVGETLVTITVLPACDICAELQQIKIILKKLLCNDEKILKYIHLS